MLSYTHCRARVALPSVQRASTPLMAAAHFGHIAVARALLDAGCDTEATNSVRSAVLLGGVRCDEHASSIGARTLLPEVPIDVMRDRHRVITASLPVHFNCLTSRPLPGSGSTQFGKTALSYAIESGNPDILALLVR